MTVSNSMLASKLERRSWFFAAGFLLWVSLDFGYRFFVSKNYDYAGFAAEISYAKYLEGVLIYLLVLFFSPNLLKVPSDYFVAFLVFGLICPLLVFYGLANQEREHLYIVLFGFFIVNFVRKGRIVKLFVLREGYWLAVSGVLLLTFLISLWFFVSGGVRYFNLDLTQVYEFRRGAGEIINTGVMAYLNVWLYKVLGPSLLAIALWKGRFFLAVLVLFLHLYWFGVSAHKAVLFYPFLVVFLWFWFRRSRALFIIPIAMSALVISTLMLAIFVGFDFPASLFIRRAFFVIANNVFDYYEFFSANEHVYWSNSVLSRFIEYPYDLNPADTIGRYRGTDSHVNNSFLSTGFMHAGIWGVVFYGVLAGLLFRLIDSFGAYGVPVWVAVAILIVPSRSLLLSADLPTALLTHGIGVGVLILFLLRRTRSERVGLK
ncbi:hypothetical protein [Halomonas faecis]|uniref:hypothetical protein n=1 Tax=Halomonas faecis TaxID=1562110 RepID=UPI0013D348AF|nr:hypothetical protein [Halomonas faecis]